MHARHIRDCRGPGDLDPGRRSAGPAGSDHSCADDDHHPNHDRRAASGDRNRAYSRPDRRHGDAGAHPDGGKQAGDDHRQADLDGVGCSCSGAPGAGAEPCSDARGAQGCYGPGRLAGSGRYGSGASSRGRTDYC